MKKCLVLLPVILMTITVLAQKPEELFEKAGDYYQEEQYDSALLIFEKIYKKGKGDEALIAKSFYNMGDIYAVKKNYAKAKEIFSAILDADYDEMDKGGLGEGIMGEPYALYKNNSAKRLAEIALIEKNYSAALNYTDLFYRVYPYHHFCGNEYKSDEIYVAYTYARCYQGLQQTDRAISSLLPECMYSGLASNGYVVEMACDLIREKYSKEQIRQELEQAVSQVKFKTRGKGRYKYDYYYTRVFGREMEITMYSGSLDYKIAAKLEGIELYKMNFITSEFYKTLTK
jgi:tetratricopeptide (TPR) repeat protein